MSDSYAYGGTRRRGFFASVDLAFRIAKGSLRLLRGYPKLIVPLLPTFIMMMMTIVGILFISNVILALSVVFALAYALMFSFAITSHMLKQIHEGRSPSLVEAFGSPSMLRMLPRVLLLSVIWYILVGILVAIETAVRTLLDRINDSLADAVIEAVLGTIADALRMAGFMMVAIMIFEDIGFGASFKRLKEVVKDSPIVAVGGLTLTKMASLAIFAVVFVLSEFLGNTDPGLLAFGLVIVALASGWMLAIYLEQLFVTGLYLYATVPHSPLVGIMLQGQLGRELPDLPTPDLVEQPAL